MMHFGNIRMETVEQEKESEHVAGSKCGMRGDMPAPCGWKPLGRTGSITYMRMEIVE